MKMFPFVIAIGAIGLALLLLMSRMNEQDMKVCQLSHSFDVCFQALNR